MTSNQHETLRIIAAISIIFTATAFVCSILSYNGRDVDIWEACVGNKYELPAIADKLILIDKCKEILGK